MREIKFRGKRVDNGEWVYGYVFTQSVATSVDDNNNLISEDKYFIYDFQINDDFDEYEIIPETLGQYTGLKDKNGVEIYEGDIIKWSKMSDKYIIEFEEGNMMLKDEDEFHHIFIDMTFCEVIGNVFDNPELLKESE